MELLAQKREILGKQVKVLKENGLFALLSCEDSETRVLLMVNYYDYNISYLAEEGRIPVRYNVDRILCTIEVVT